MTKKYKTYLKSQKWKEIREAVKKKQKVCRICKSKDNLEVHHPYYKGLIFQEENQLNKLILTCSFHHKYHYHRDKTILKHIDKIEKLIYVLFVFSLMMEIRR